MKIADPQFADRVRDSFAKDDQEKLCALMQQTIMVMQDKAEK